MMTKMLTRMAVVLIFGVSMPALAALREGQVAPDWTLKNQAGKVIKLKDRIGKGWTILFFYPKAGSPGCTKEACAFRDAVKKIEKGGDRLFGISVDTMEAQKKFSDEHKLAFDLLSDADAKVVEAYGLKIPIMGISRRWTFILDEKLVIQGIDKDVDPAFNAEWTVDEVAQLKDEKKVAEAAAKEANAAGAGKGKKGAVEAAAALKAVGAIAPTERPAAEAAPVEPKK